MPGEPDRDPRIEYRRICEYLTKDDARNAAICSDVRQSVRADRAPLVLTERVDHRDALGGGLRAIGASVVVLRGGMGSKALKTALARAAEHVPGQVLLATGRFIGEGFDDARLDTLFLTIPVSWRGTIAQYVGRLHRLLEHKPVPSSRRSRPAGVSISSFGSPHPAVRSVVWPSSTNLTPETPTIRSGAISSISRSNTASDLFSSTCPPRAKVRRS